MRLRWDIAALAELDSIGAYISRDSPRAAKRVVAYIRRVTENLEFSPRMGRQVDGDLWREIVLRRYPYLVAYRIEGDEILILSVTHQSRDRPSR